MANPTKPADAQAKEASARAKEAAAAKELAERASLIEAQARHAANLNVQRLAQRDPAVRSLLAERDAAVLAGKQTAETIAGLIAERDNHAVEKANVIVERDALARELTTTKAEREQYLTELKAAAEQIKDLQKQLKAAAKKPATPEAGA